MRTLLVLHQGAIGDFLLTLPVIQSVREHIGRVSVTVVASAASARLAAGRSVVDRWLCPEDLGLYRLFCRDLPVSDSLVALLDQPDAVVSFLGSPTDVVHGRLRGLTRARLVSIDPRPWEATRRDRVHLTRQWTDDIRRADWQIEDSRPATLRFDRPAPPVVPRVLLHPGSGGRAKCWPLDRYVELAESLPGTEVTWMLGPAEADQARRMQDRNEPILFESELCRAAEQMARHDLYVGNDSGITHLAAAIGLETVAIFGTTDPRLWRPLGERVSILAPDEPQDDMTHVSVSDVRSVVLGRLAGLLSHQAI